MPNVIKYSTSPQTLALKSGNYWIGTGDVGKGPTSSSDYWNGITPPTSGYTIYINKASQGPSIYTPLSDSDLIVVTNMIGGSSFTSTTQCFNWYNTQSDKMVFNKDYPLIITSGLSRNLDAGFRPSYSTSGVTWYDLSPSGNNGTLTNGPTFSSSESGSIVFDGVNDYVLLSSIDTNSNFTLEFWVKRNAGSGTPTLISGTAQTGYLQIRMNPGDISLVKSSIAELGNFGAGSATSSGVIYQVVLTRSSNTYTAFVNGSQKNTLTFSQTFTTTSPTLGITFSNSEPFMGNIYRFYYYNRQLSSSEISQNFYGGNIVTDGMTLCLDAGNIASYPQTGTVWRDISVNNNNGTLINGPTFNSANGGSIVFDGTNDYVSVNSNSTINFTTAMTVCVWVKLDSNTDGYGDILGKFDYTDANNNGGYILRYYNGAFGVSGRLDFIILNNGFYSVNSDPGTNFINLNTWYYFCGTYNGSQQALYVNGILQSSVSFSSNVKTSVSPLVIPTPFAGAFFGGNLAVVQAYNVGLTASQVLQNYNAQKSRFGL